VRERICLPLGMRDTVVTPTGEQAARLATGYTRRGRPAPPLEIPALVGAGALCSPRPTCCAFCGPTSTLPTPRWPPRSNAPSFPASEWPSGWRSGSAGCSPARLGCWSRALAQRRDRRLFVAVVREPTRPWSCSATPPDRSAAWAAPAQGAGQRRRPGRWLITVETGSRRRRGLARGSAPAARRSTGPG
jgi:CubicO group peptidase (beta-lactamase class C family)